MGGLLAGLIGGYGAIKAGTDIAGGIQRKRASEAHAEAMRKAAKDYSKYREALAPAQMQALQQVMSLYNPMNEHMARSYGPEYKQDFTQVFKNPISDDMMGASPFTASQKELASASGKLNEFFKDRGVDAKYEMRDGKLVLVKGPKKPAAPQGVANRNRSAGMADSSWKPGDGGMGG